jgi:hypothetical protein
VALYLLRSTSGQELEHESGDRLLRRGDFVDEHGRWLVLAVLEEALEPFVQVLLVAPVA